MKALLRKLLRERSTEFYVAGVLLWLLPGLTLVILGLVHLWQNGWFWWFSGALLILSVISWGMESGQTMPRPSSPARANTASHGIWQVNGVRLNDRVPNTPSASTSKSRMGTGIS